MCSLARGYSASKPSPSWILSLRCPFIGSFVAVDAMALLVSLSLLIRPNSYRPLKPTTTVIVRSSQQGQWSLDSVNISLQDLSNAVWMDACRGCQVGSNSVLVKGLVTPCMQPRSFITPRRSAFSVAIMAFQSSKELARCGLKTQTLVSNSLASWV